MDAAELDGRFRSYSRCITPYLVTRLLDLGHTEEVARQAGRGEWFCAQELARRLAGRERWAEAREVLAPYVATGWWTAVEAAAGLLEQWGKPDEAIALARPHARVGDRPAMASFARLLARHGRAGEAFELLLPHAGDGFLVTVLVEVAAPAGRDEDVAALLAARVGAAPSPALEEDLLATVRERRGRVDEAIALLRPRSAGSSWHAHDRFADLLARHDRIGELRTYAAELEGPARRLAELLEERGDVEGAIAVYRMPEGSQELRRFRALRLAELLGRHGRVEEAVAVLRSLGELRPGPEDWLVRTLCSLYADFGRAEEGLAFLDTLDPHDSDEAWAFFEARLPLLAACGRREEAIAQVRAHPEGDTWYGASALGGLLAEGGRLEEAVTVLGAHASGNSRDLAEHLITLGRVQEALAVLRQP
ncbi:tetratricopeptide repeat protein [Streptomyces sp. NPDC058157]|uniref:tetratricopeptide repeat protein n=1 Tax=Streptomyces sp. NPDC058157 TaxID=3346360 RepID=UPI0036EE0451